MCERAALAAGTHTPAAARAMAVVAAAVGRRRLATRALPDFPGTDWWEDGVPVQALAALAAWVARYDSGEWDDPPGKLALLYDLERVGQLIRGAEPFDPDKDRAAFCRFLIDSGCQPPPGTQEPPCAAPR